jgi:hypothetical protein
MRMVRVREVGGGTMRVGFWLAGAIIVAIACGTAETGPSGGNGAGGSPDGGSGSGGGVGSGGGGAQPAQARVSVQFTGHGAGRVTSSPGGLDCPGQCTVTVATGTAMTLSAVPDGNSYFVGWGGACSGSLCTLAANGDLTAWANFEALAPPPTPACKGIAPPDQPSMLRLVDHPGQLPRTCGGAAGDAAGTLAFVLNGAHGDSVYFVNASSATVLDQAVVTMFAFPLQQPKGVSVVSGRPYLGPILAVQFGQMISSFDSTGKKTGVSTLANHSGKNNLPAAADPNGGVLLAGNLAMAPDDTVIHAAIMYDGGASSASVRWGPKLLASAGAVFGLGVDLLGRSLVITDGAPKLGAGNISAQWFDKNGAALTGEFVLLTGFSAGSSTWFETTALIGGGVLVRRMDGASNAQALVVVDSGGATARAAPDWMASRRDVKLQIARGGKAYAALPLGAKAVACTQQVEVVAPDGTSCGATDYGIASGTCDTLDLQLAEDGTVIQQLPTAMETTNDVVGGHTCTWRWWPGAVR